MKKVFSLLLMALIVLLPLNVKAATGLTVSCDNAGSNGVITCTVHYNITDATGVTDLNVTLTEKGGANVNTVTNAAGSDWTITNRSENNNVWTVTLNSPGTTGDGNLFTFTYTPSGQDDCEIEVGLGDVKVPVTPSTPDKPTDNKQTGTTLPYIALGAMVIVASAAYIATKGKAKMYKI